MTSKTYTYIDQNLDDYGSRDATANWIALNRDRYEKIRAFVRTIAPRRLIDVGCYNGMGTRYYAEDLANVELVGFDGSAAALQIARANGIDASQWRIGLEPRPETQPADIVIAAEIIEHMLEPRTFIDELLALCRPQGYLVISTPNLLFWFNRLLMLRGSLPFYYPPVSSDFSVSSKVDKNHVRVSIPSEWAAFLRSCGLSIEQVVGCSHPFLLGKGWERLVDSFSTRYLSLAAGTIFLCRRAER